MNAAFQHTFENLSCIQSSLRVASIFVPTNEQPLDREIRAP